MVIVGFVIMCATTYCNQTSFRPLLRTRIFNV